MKGLPYRILSALPSATISLKRSIRFSTVTVVSGAYRSVYLMITGLCKPSLYLPDFFERNRASYYDALMQVRTSDDIVHWVRFFLNGVAETAEKGRDTFRKILAMRMELEEQLSGMGRRATNARHLLNLLFR